MLNASSESGKYQKEGSQVDFYMLRSREEYYFEIKTVKPNIDVFEKSKTKLLQWIARKRKPVRVYLAFPYNPYAPKGYDRFTEQNLMDYQNDFLVGKEFWDFLAGEGAYDELLGLFDKAGKKAKNDIARKISSVAQNKINIEQNL